jgi:enoyl-CoA hydratase
MAYVTFTSPACIAGIVLNDPPENFISRAVMADINRFIDEELRPKIKLCSVVITGEGPNFSSGIDIKDLVKVGRNEAMLLSRIGHRAVRGLEELQVPVIAAISGKAFDIGFELALACDIRICTEDALFSMSTIKIGIPPSSGATMRLPAIVGAGRAREILYSGREVDAHEALAIGLVSRVVADQTELMDTAREMAFMIANNAPDAVRQTKTLVNMGLDRGYTERVEEEEIIAFAESFGPGSETRAGMEAFLAGSKSPWSKDHVEWCKFQNEPQSPAE